MTVFTNEYMGIFLLNYNNYVSCFNGDRNLDHHLCRICDFFSTNEIFDTQFLFAQTLKIHFSEISHQCERRNASNEKAVLASVATTTGAMISATAPAATTTKIRVVVTEVVPSVI